VNHIDFFVNGNIPWDGVDLYIKVNGEWATDEVPCVAIPEGQAPPVAMRLTASQAQNLMDRLYQAGLRPTQDKGSEATLAAVQKHLEDMRVIAFTEMEIVKP